MTVLYPWGVSAYLKHVLIKLAELKAIFKFLYYCENCTGYISGANCDACEFDLEAMKPTFFEVPLDPSPFSDNLDPFPW